MGKFITALKKWFTVPVSSHRWTTSKNVDEKLAIIARAHSIYFSRKCLISYEDIVKGWFRTMGFCVDSIKSNITPYTAGCTVRVYYPYGGSDGGVYVSVILFTQTA